MYRADAWKFLNEENAVSDYNKSIELEEENDYFYYKRGKLYAKRGNNENALNDFNKVIEMAPNHSEVYNEIGRVYSDMGDNNKAYEYFNKAIEVEAPYEIELYYAVRAVALSR